MTLTYFIKSKLPWYVLSLLIVASGFVGFRVMGAMKTPVEATPPQILVPKVQTVNAQTDIRVIPVRAEGFVRPFRSISLAAQTGGRITALHPSMESLGSFEQGEVLVQLDDRAAKTQVRSIQANLDLVQRQLQRAQDLKKSNVVSQDQLEQLESQQTQLIAQLDSAQVQLENTRVKAPFAGRVRQQVAQLGSVVGTGQSIAEIYTDQTLEVTVSLTESEAALIPGLFQGANINAEIQAQFGELSDTWLGKIQRVTPGLNAQTRTIQVTIRIQDSAPKAFPLLPNAFVNVRVLAPATDLVAIPASALQADAQVWLADGDTLRIQSVEPRYIDRDRIYLAESDALIRLPVIISTLSNARTGMQIEAIGQQNASAD